MATIERQQVPEWRPKGSTPTESTRHPPTTSVGITPANLRQATIGSGYNLPSHGSLAEARDLSKLVGPGIPLNLLTASPHLIDHSARS